MDCVVVEKHVDSWTRNALKTPASIYAAGKALRRAKGFRTAPRRLKDAFSHGPGISEVYGLAALLVNFADCLGESTAAWF
ncbi:MULTISPECIES: hypothetical protein [Pyrobaculum]|uniref:Uncharacterized protein n=2 Tax=Pyrobaculum arsenaticum TaxID=121277 RepID=A4WMY2_PYRAR|nr:hypothetical protein [Pyrobaculum arsenaticum]ABP51749.1 hypothetical protein Pars_2203 [Pyrobaculum arsenaticum DSM 13514]NYR16068.1 hypothetical protein [Pyrobaculum arsenaticum]